MTKEEDSHLRATVSTRTPKSSWKSTTLALLSSLVAVCALLVYVREYELPTGKGQPGVVAIEPPPQAVVCPVSFHPVIQPFTLSTTSSSIPSRSTFSVHQGSPSARPAFPNQISSTQLPRSRPSSRSSTQPFSPSLDPMRLSTKSPQTTRLLSRTKPRSTIQSPIRCSSPATPGVR
jgi:hypothetical protein